MNQPTPPPTTPGLSDKLGGMKLSARILKGGISRPTHTTHPNPIPTNTSLGVVIDECICSAKCENVRKRVDVDREFCSDLEVGNSHDRNVIVKSRGLELDEFICTAKCLRHCKKENVMKDVKLGIIYCPGLGLELPNYIHTEYKPRFSAQRSNIIQVGTSTTTFFLETENSFHAEPDPVEMAGVEQPVGDERSGGQGDV